MHVVKFLKLGLGTIHKKENKSESCYIYYIQMGSKIKYYPWKTTLHYWSK